MVVHVLHVCCGSQENNKTTETNNKTFFMISFSSKINQRNEINKFVYVNLILTYPLPSTYRYPTPLVAAEEVGIDVIAICGAVI